MSRVRSIGRPTRPLDWVLLALSVAHNIFYVITTAFDNAIMLTTNQIKHRDDTELAWQELTVDLESLEDDDARRWLPEA